MPNTSVASPPPRKISTNVTSASAITTSVHIRSSALCLTKPRPSSTRKILFSARPGGAERARGAVERGREADDQRHDRGAALLLGGLQRAASRRRRCPAARPRHAGSAAASLISALLPEDAQQGGAEQQRREQRQQRVVRERGGVVGDLVLAEARRTRA